ncbi:MAG TPA: lysophospholipid acyltransferase family protein [Dictyobacter sp.]|jgi:1-acyl-sn-glycerol-3-phosphate acyltransferase|nr:lysophospholipid acyltransferase family protein [Dictyobacter sp.]
MKQETDATNSAGKSAQSEQAKKPEKNLYEPYSTPRVLYEALRFFAKFVFFIIIRLHLRGRYNIPRKGPYIIASNHLSWTDIPLVPLNVPGKVVYMAKEESFYSKMGWLVRFLGAFPVKRNESDRQAIRAAITQLRNKKVFIIYPEGTRSKTRTLAKGHNGLGMIALMSGVPVVPVAIWGSENTFKKFGAHVTVSYGEPIVFKPKGTKATREDIESTTEEVMRRIADMLPERYRGVYL